MFIYYLCVVIFLPYFCYGVEVYEKIDDPKLMKLMKIIEEPDSEIFKKSFFLKKKPSDAELLHYEKYGSKINQVELEQEKTNKDSINKDSIGCYMIPYRYIEGRGLVLRKCDDNVIELKMGSQCSVYSEKKYYKLLAAVLRDWVFGSTQYGFRFENKGHPIRSYWENKNIGKKIKRKIKDNGINTNSLVKELKGLKSVLGNLDSHFVSMGMFITQSSSIKIFDFEHPYEKKDGNPDEFGIINGITNLIALIGNQ